MTLAAEFSDLTLKTGHTPKEGHPQLHPPHAQPSSDPPSLSCTCLFNSTPWDCCPCTALKEPALFPGNCGHFLTVALSHLSHVAGLCSTFEPPLRPERSVCLGLRVLALKGLRYVHTLCHNHVKAGH